MFAAGEPVGDGPLRVAVVCPRVPRRRELAIGPLDAEWIAEMGGRHDLELFVDRLSPITDGLRAGGVPVRESIKRWATADDGSYRSSDSFLARSILGAHRRHPFDAILHTSLATTPLPWFEPELAAIPRGCAIGSGAGGDLHAVWQDAELFSQLGRRLWAMTGLLASADFLVADTPIESFGFSPGAPLPPRLRSRRMGAVPRPEVPRRGLVVVVATTAGASDLDRLLPQAIGLLDVTDELVVALLTGLRRPDAGRLAATLDATGRLRSERLLVVPVGEDGVAADFLEEADLVLLGSPAELAIPRVAEVAERRGALLADGSAVAQDDAGVLGRRCLPRRRRCDIHILSFDALRSKAFADASDLGIAPDDLVIVYSGGGDTEAAVLFEVQGPAGVDLVVWGRPAGLYGDPDPEHIYPHAMAVRAAALPSLVRAAEKADSLWTLIAWALDVDRVDRVRLLLLPTTPRAETRPLPPASDLRAPWLPVTGLLPAPRYVPAHATSRGPAAAALFSSPRPRARAEASARGRTLEEWLRITRWPQRLRASLPWRWGFLERALRHDW